MKSYLELEKERSLQKKGELVYYVFSFNKDGLTGCIGFAYRDEALDYIKRLNRPCWMKTYQIIDTEDFNNFVQLSIF